jgi:2',3'-cyclic-nucleotide 2'-phosphodiesterase (5'-nucleotidase family)
VIDVRDADGTAIKVGLFGVLIDTGRKPWVEYSDPLAAAEMQYKALDPVTDVVLGITHLAIDDDKKVAARLPGVALIMGGHEHNNMLHHVGPVTITKADANAKTVYVHTLRHVRSTGKTTVKSELRRIDAKLADEPATAAVVAKWEKVKNEALTGAGFDPSRRVTELPQPLDAREALLRHQQGGAGAVITAAMMKAARRQPDAALLNSGSVRVDDILSGALTELDVVRMLPFGGGLVEVEMRGSLLRRMLDTGVRNRGNGGYLQRHGIEGDEAKGDWRIAGQPLDDKRVYRLILPDFLLTGNEQNMDFLKTTANAEGPGTSNPDVPALYKPDPKDAADVRNDVRHAVIGYLRK